MYDILPCFIAARLRPLSVAGGPQGLTAGLASFVTFVSAALLVYFDMVRDPEARILNRDLGDAMLVTLRTASLFMAAALLFLAGSAVAGAGYKIHDDCLGDWEYCDSLWRGKLDRFGRDAFITRPFTDEEELISPGPGELRKSKMRLGCRKGLILLARSGFRQLRSIDCQGTTYIYVGRKGEGTFKIRLSSRSGRILGIDPI